MKVLKSWILIVIVFASCNDDVNVTLEKEPGTLYGRVFPLNINAQIELYQGGLLKTTTADNDGYFSFSSLDAGGYVVKVKADNYGRTEQTVQINDGEGYDMGTIELIDLPFPLRDIQPWDGAIDVLNHFNNARITVYTLKNVNIQDFENAISIVPAVDDILVSGSSSRISPTYFRIAGKFLFDQQYTIHIDTTLETQSGEKLEFPLTSTFTTEKFKVINFYNYQNIDRGSFDVLVRFNSDLDYSAMEHITIAPDIPVDMYFNYNGEIRVRPEISWPCDTTISIIMDEFLSDLSGSQLGSDTTLYFIMPALKVIDTDPYNGQQYIDTYDNIYITFNNSIAEGTIANSINVSPSINYNINTDLYSGQSRIYIEPDSLISNTEYTVTIDTSLHGYYMGHLNNPYEFKFHTK